MGGHCKVAPLGATLFADGVAKRHGQLTYSPFVLAAKELQEAVGEIRIAQSDPQSRRAAVDHLAEDLFCLVDLFLGERPLLLVGGKTQVAQG